MPGGSGGTLPPPASMTHAAGGSLSNAPWNNISSIHIRQKHRFHGADVTNFLRHFQKRLTGFFRHLIVSWT